MSNQSLFTVHVAGDSTVDWMLVSPPEASGAAVQVSYRWDRGGSTGLSAQPGGAALLTTLLGRLLADAGAPPAAVSGVALSQGVLEHPNDPSMTRVFTRWSVESRERGSREHAWRMCEFLGLRPAVGAPPVAGGGGPIAPACLVLDDANHGFRLEREAWPAALREGGRPAQIVLKLAGPLAVGPLWEHLIAAHADRLTVYLAIGDLRKEYGAVGEPLSWERTSRDLVKAVRSHPGLPRAARVVVSLGLAGAVLVERDGPATLVFDPAHQEGDWEGRHPGTPYMSGTCIVSALTLAALGSPGDLGQPHRRIARIVNLANMG